MGEVFPAVVYILCFLTSASCAALLARSYHTTGHRLLFWSSICFGFLALNNVALILDLVVFPDLMDLRIARSALALFAVVSLIWGFIWQADEDWQ